MSSNKYNKNYFPSVFGSKMDRILKKNDLNKVHGLFDLDHVKAMQKIPSQINKPFTFEHDT